MSKASDEERKAFENWAKRHGLSTIRVEAGSRYFGEYDQMRTEIAWKAWEYRALKGAS